ncbi:putative phage tail component-like protein [Paenibacillus turicensis]|uniref:Phage tail component-like protein n=1 Tax=Paenibacillus turicensis TaxID=160487 RepID=A0ABS4FWW3_9BACL|nr:distal tail protein Dit [Paenibacillus turicensis]MBP1907073.1 putative phage tail component-like protein [Paenibacillus turicensis]
MNADVVLTLGGKTPRELGMRVLRESQRPIAPSTVDNLVTVPYMHGAYDFGAYLAPRQLTLECALVAKNSIELQQLISALARFLIGADGRPKTMPIIFRSQPDRWYMARYSGDLQITRVVGLGTFTLPFTAYDPFAYSTYESIDINVDNENINVDSDISVDTAYTFDISGPDQLSVTNNGNQNVEPVIQITGSFNSLSITLGDVTFTYNAPISGTLVIDFKRKTAMLDNVNVLHNTNAKFGELPTGVSNVDIAGTGLNISMSIIFRNKFI